MCAAEVSECSGAMLTFSDWLPLYLLCHAPSTHQSATCQWPPREHQTGTFQWPCWPLCQHHTGIWSSCSWQHQTSIYRCWPPWQHHSGLRWCPYWPGQSSSPHADTNIKPASDSIVPGNRCSTIMWRLSTSALQPLRRCHQLRFNSCSQWGGSTVTRCGGWLRAVRGCRRWYWQTAIAGRIWV